MMQRLKGPATQRICLANLNVNNYWLLGLEEYYGCVYVTGLLACTLGGDVINTPLNHSVIFFERTGCYIDQ